MSFPASFLEDIRNRLSLSSVIGSKLRLVRSGREFKGCCPFHNEKTPSFYVNDDKQFFHCFGCGAHGDIIGFTMRYERLSFPEAIESLAAQAGLQVPRETPLEREKFDAEKRLYQTLEAATVWFEEQLFAPSGREALSYLRGRGLTEDAILRFRLGYAPLDGQGLLRKMLADGYKLDELAAVGLAKKAEERDEYYSFFRNRVIFPVGDRRGRTVAFGARILGEGEPKYLNSPDHSLFHKGKLLYGLSRARAALAQGQPLIVVEGYMDVIALAEAGFMGAVAPLGTALTEDQMQILWRLLPSVETREAARDYSPILCFDSDPAGMRASARAVERALPLLTSAQTLRIATLTGAKDPDELIRRSGKSAFDALIKQAQPMIDVLWSLALAGRPMRTPEERGAFSAVLKQRVGLIKDDHLRELYQNEFKKRIDQAFGWKQSHSHASRGGPKSDWNNGGPLPFIGSRRAPQNGQRVMEKIILALLINHPELYDEFGESLAQIDFQTPELESLRQRVVEILSQAQNELLDAPELRRSLSKQNGPERIFGTPSIRSGESLLDEVLSPDTYMHARAAAPHTAQEEARKAWLAIRGRIEKSKITTDYAAACALYREMPTEENQSRMEALRTKVMFFSADAEQSSFFE